MSKVILICGKICSGKTFYAREIKKAERAVLLSVDEVTYDLIDNIQGPVYDAFVKRVNAYLLKKTAELADAGCTVILDWGFWTRKERQDTTAYFAARNIAAEWHYIDIGDDAWHRNIKERNQRVLAGEGGSDFFVDEGLFGKVTNRFEPPRPEEIDVWYIPTQKERTKI